MVVVVVVVVVVEDVVVSRSVVVSEMIDGCSYSWEDYRGCKHLDRFDDDVQIPYDDYARMSDDCFRS